MKSRPSNWFWIIAKFFIVTIALVATTGAICISFLNRSDQAAQKALAETRRLLRQQGFKTDPADFNFPTDAATQARAAALTVSKWRQELYWPLELYMRRYDLDLLPVVSNDTAAVFWKNDSLIARGISDWSGLRSVLDTNHAALDEACVAALGGPIRFDTDLAHGSETLLHLSVALGSRAMLELREGNLNAAWTNLLAATRFATAWEAGPSQMSHIFRSHLTKDAFASTWQAMQNQGWTDARLAVLQQEWESANFFTNLPETAAFTCVEAVERCHIEAQQPPLGNWSSSALAREVIARPKDGFSELTKGVDRMRYSRRGAFVDEKNLLLYFQTYETQLCHAVQSSTWAEMRAQPGVTNPVPFETAFEGFDRYMGFNYREFNLVPARAAEAEARRRILITALALERYRGKHGDYPATLAPLASEFLKAVPVDFMDGQPLRYRRTADCHFVLYSVGLDCVDDGGKMPPPKADTFPIDGWGLFRAPKNMDIVWPRPDSGR